MTATRRQAAQRPHQSGAEPVAETAPDPGFTAGAAAIIVNGESRRITQPISLAHYLASVSLDSRAVVIEHNGVILRDRESFQSLALKSGDVLEILHFVGGG